MESVIVLPKISVVIGTLGRNELLKGTLHSLFKQKFDPASFEIIVVTNGGTQVGEFIRRLPKPKKLCVKLVYCNYQWVAPKRNIGIRLAKHPLVAFIDDDCLADPNWLSTISNQFDKNPGIAGLEGQTTNNTTGLFEHATQNLKGGLYPTCNLAFRKEILLRVGGFDEAYTYHREDTDLAFKVMSFGPIPFCGDMKVFHVTRETSYWSVLKEVRWVRGDVRIYKKFPERYLSSFGYPAQGALKQGLFTSGLAVVGAYGIATNPTMAVLAAAAFVTFTYLTILSKRKWTIVQGLAYIVLSFVRNTLFLPAFLYYWAAMPSSENPLENNGWEHALEFDVEEY